MIRKIIEKLIYTNKEKRYTLEAILDHAVKNTNYYSTFNYNDLNSFPILTKDIIRERFEDLKSKDLNKRKWMINTSGGSTGEPTKFVQDNEYMNISRTTKYIYKKKLGYDFGDVMIKIWGDEKEVLNNSKSFKNIMVNKIKNIIFLNSFNMTVDNMKKYIKVINTKKPKLIVAYVNAIYELSLFAKENNISINHKCPIMTGAGTLHDFMKKTIEEVFDTKVYNRYGGREVGNIAYEVPGLDGLELTRDVHIEIIDENGNKCQDGVEGNIIVTSLINYAMPLIRYQIGDRGILLKDEKGTQYLKKVTGRIMETFRNDQGKIIPAEYFIHVIGVVLNKKNNWIKKFQVVQKKLDHVIVYIIKSKTESIEDINKIILSIKKVMGENCVVDVVFVNKIDTLKSGKYVYTKCEI